MAAQTAQTFVDLCRQLGISATIFVPVSTNSTEDLEEAFKYVLSNLEKKHDALVREGKRKILDEYLPRVWDQVDGFVRASLQPIATADLIKTIKAVHELVQKKTK